MSSSSLVVKVLTLTGVEFEFTLHQPASSASSSSSTAHARRGTAASSHTLLRVSDVKRLLPFPARCTTLVHRGAAASDDRTLTSLRVSDPFVVILDKAAWRQSLASAAAANTNCASSTSNKRALPSYCHDDDDEAEDEDEEAAAAAAAAASYDPSDISSGSFAAHNHKRFRRSVTALGSGSSGVSGSGSELLDDARRFEQLEEAMRRRRERRYQPIVLTAPPSASASASAAAPAAVLAAAESKEREAKDSEERSVQADGEWGQLSRYRQRRQPPPSSEQQQQQQQFGGGAGSGGAVAAGSSGSSSGWAALDGNGSGSSALNSVSSRLRSSIARVEQLRDARDRLVQLQHRSRQQHSSSSLSVSIVPPSLPPPRPSSRLSASSSSSSAAAVRVALEQLEGMGFPSQSAEQALKRCGGVLSDAIELLMIHDRHYTE